MEKTTLFYLIILVPLLFAGSCKEDDISPDTLPPATQEGLNTFGCIIDGKNMLPKDYSGSIGGFPSKGLVAKYQSNESYVYFDIISRNGNNSYSYIYIYIPNIGNSGVFNFGRSNGNQGPLDSPPYPHALIIKQNPTKKRQVYYSYENSGQITISRFDEINTIVSGTFELKVLDIDNPTDTIKITSGRFDINWIEL